MAGFDTGMISLSTIPQNRHDNFKSLQYPGLKAQCWIKFLINYPEYQNRKKSLLRIKFLIRRFHRKELKRKKIGFLSLIN